jgi:hypothetical protein
VSVPLSLICNFDWCVCGADRFNVSRDPNVLESAALLACILLLLVVPKSLNTVALDIGITGRQLEMLLTVIIGAMLVWALGSLCGILFLWLKKCRRSKRDKMSARDEVCCRA